MKRTEPTSTSWNQLFVKYSEPVWDSVYRFSVSLCRNEADAEDLTQQTLMKSLHALPTFFKNNYSVESESEAEAAAARQGLAELRSHLLNWMLRICKNTFLDSRSRAHQKLKHISLDDWFEESEFSENQKSAAPSGTPNGHLKTINESSESIADAEKAFFEQALDDEWKERFASLNPRQRSIVYLAAEDYSYKEIAQILEIPIGTVMSTLSRALSKLKKPADTSN